MTKHNKELENYNADFKTLANELGNLRYDALAEFLDLLSNKIRLDGIADENRGRNKLANQLKNAAENLKNAVNSIEEAWRICKPYMDSYER